MALYWPDQKVALDIIDDPLAEHCDDELLKGWKILRVTCAQVNDLEETRRIGDELCKMLGHEPPEKTPEWLAANERLFNSLHAENLPFEL